MINEVSKNLKEKPGSRRLQWMIDGYDPDTKRRIKAFAVKHDMTIPEALTAICDIAGIE